MDGLVAVLFALLIGIVAGFIGRGKWDQRQTRKGGLK